MRAIFALLLISAAFLTSYAQQWHSSYVPYLRAVNTIAILDRNAIVVGGGNLSNDSLQALYRSNDYGLMWNMNPTDNISSWIKSISFSDTLHGFGVGFNGKMVSTADGGRSWIFRHSPVERHFFKVEYVSASTLFAVGGNYLSDTMTILKSTDNANTWNVVLNTSGKWVKAISFIDTLNGFAVGDSGIILHTINGGISWAAITTPVLRDFNAVTFVNADTGYIAGGESGTNQTRTILKTTDGGSSWNISKDESGSRLNDVSFADNMHGYAVGDSATCFTTTDGGQTWVAQSIPNSIPNDNFNVVKYFASDFILIGSQFGRVSLYAGTGIPEILAEGHYSPFSNSATLYALVNTHGYPAQYKFTIDTTSNFSNPIAANWPIDVNSDTIAQIEALFYNLQPNVTYYYFLTLSNIDGSYYGDTLSFTTGTGLYQVQTENADSITETSARAKGFVQQFPVSATVYFEYDTTQTFSHSVLASPSLINDTMKHEVTASLSGLLPYSKYYYRLTAVTANGLTYRGNIQSFVTFNNGLYSKLEILSATNITDSSATLNAVLDKFQVAANLVFEYGTNPLQLSDSIVATPTNINDTLPHPLHANLNNLQPYTYYYFRIRAATKFGSYFSSIDTFFTGHLFVTLQIQPASKITTYSAQLNALFQSLASDDTLTFEYGTTLSFGNEIAASPNIVSDNVLHQVSATLPSLTSNTLYYYRLRLNTNGFVVYTHTKQFFAGQNEIPNWDFENWQHITQVALSDMFTLGNVDIVTSYNGTKAAYLYSTPEMPAGLVANAPLGLHGPGEGGSPFTSLPDSLIFYSAYDIQPGDTGYVLLVFKKNGTINNQVFFPITGNTSGVFKRQAFNIPYTNFITPDTVILGFLNTNILNGQVGNTSSWMKIDDVSFSGTSQNIPDPGFENWDTVQYDAPERWGLSLIETPVNLLPFVPFTKSTDAYSGDYAIRFQSIYQPPVIKVAYINTSLTNEDGSPNFPVNHRYQTLNGYCKFLPENGDTLKVFVWMFKNGQPVGWGNLSLVTPVTSYNYFSVPLMYNDTSTIPDSCSIRFSTSENHTAGNSIVYLDNLGFDGFYGNDTTSSIWPVVMASDSQITLKVFPNPAESVLYILASGFIEGATEYEIININGQKMDRFSDVHSNTLLISKNISHYPAGIYLVTAHGSSGNVSSRFIKQ